MELRFGRGFAPPLRRSFRRHRLGETWKTTVTKVRQRYDKAPTATQATPHHRTPKPTTIIGDQGEHHRRNRGNSKAQSARPLRGHGAKRTIVIYGVKFFLSNTVFELCNTGSAIGEYGGVCLISRGTIGNFLTLFLLIAISCERLPCFPGKTWRMGKFFSGELPYSTISNLS